MGSIEAGKRADLAVVRRDRQHTTPADGADVYSELVYAHRADDIDTVVVDGRVVVAGAACVRLTSPPSKPKPKPNRPPYKPGPPSDGELCFDDLSDRL